MARLVVRQGPGPLAIAIVGASLLTAACGASQRSSGVASLHQTTSTSTSLPSGPSGTYVPSSQLLAFSSCLRSHGEPSFPDPLPAGGFDRSALRTVDQNSPQFATALKACWSLAIATGFAHTSAEIEQHVEQETAEDGCMRKHGVPNMPDPNSQGQQSFPANITPSSPQFQAAQKICAYLNP